MNRGPQPGELEQVEVECNTCGKKIKFSKWAIRLYGIDRLFCNDECIDADIELRRKGMKPGHGWVVPNPDGSKARCGGPGICGDCAKEYYRIHGRNRPPMEPKQEIKRYDIDEHDIHELNEAWAQGQYFRFQDAIGNMRQHEIPQWATHFAHMVPGERAPALIEKMRTEK